MSLALSHRSDERLPLYQRLRDVFTAHIVEGRWRPGAPVPAEDALATEHGVALGTVRKALEGLVASGHLERRQGRGTYVRRPAFRNALARFFRMTDAAGDPVQPEARILRRRTGLADAAAAAKLGAPLGSKTIELFRVRLVDGRPILAEEITLPFAPFAALMDLPTREFGDLLYPLYERVAGRAVARAREQITFGRAPSRVAAALGVENGAPVAIIDRIACGFDDAPLEARRSYGPAERFSYAVDIR